MEPNTVAILRWEAQRLAAAGGRAAALELLERLGDAGGADTAVLRGKLLGQQGRFGPAAESFRQALALEPDHEEAKRGLAAAERFGRGPLGRLRMHAKPVLAGIVVMAALAGAIWSGVAAWRDSNRRLAESVAALDRRLADSGSGLMESTAAIRERIKSLESALETQRQASGKANEQTRAQLRRMQAQLEGLKQK